MTSPSNHVPPRPICCTCCVQLNGIQITRGIHCNHKGLRFDFCSLACKEEHNAIHHQGEKKVQ